MALSKHREFEEAVQSRKSGSITAAVLLVPVILIAYVWLINLNIFHLFSSISDSVYSICRLSLWVQVVIMSLIVILVSITSWKHFTVMPVVLTSRFALLRHVLHPERWLHALAHGLAGGVSAWLLTGICRGRYQSITQVCDHDRDLTCMNEYHVFVVCYGFYVGVMYSVHFIHHQKYHIVFPCVQQPRYFRVKNAVLPTLTENLYAVLHHVRYYYLIYWLFLGNYLREWICGTLNIHQSTARMDTIYGLVDVSLLWTMVLSGLCIRLCWHSGVVFYKIFVTMPFHFPVETALEGKTALVDALANTSRPLMAYHGFSHLYHIAQFRPDQRLDVFSLSQPGGHPHNWTGILTECLRILTDLCERVNRYNDLSPLMRNGHMDIVQKVADGGPLTYRKPAPTPETLIPPYDMNATDSASSTPAVTHFDKVLMDVEKKPTISYFFSELPELLSRQLFATCQLQIWVLEALSLLVCASLKEDEYGVVQRQIAPIVTSILSLQEAVERHAKLGLNGRGRLGVGRKLDLDSVLRNGLRQSLRTALYRITKTFGANLCDLNLSYEYKRRLENYLDYKE